MDRDVLVVGAGVIGLTTAVRLAEAGHRVEVRAEHVGPGTTSYAAGATWSPYLVEDSPRVRGWAGVTLGVLRSLAGRPGTGVALVDGLEAARAPVPPPAAKTVLDGFRPCPPDELPAGLTVGWRYRAPVVDMPVYLEHLRRRAEAAGVRVRRARVDSLTGAPVVVDCAGTGAARLARDPALVPVRGQVVVVRNPGVTEFFVDEGDPPRYFFPHGATVLLGGTAQPGVADRAPDPAVARAIVARCAQVEPRLAGAHVVEHRVGLRPVRPAVRLSAGDGPGGRVVHNYGHGGAGVTLSWGCADEVVRLVAG